MGVALGAEEAVGYSAFREAEGSKWPHHMKLVLAASWEEVWISSERVPVAEGTIWSLVAAAQDHTLPDARES